MSKFHIGLLVLSTGVFSGCSTFRWSGHDDGNSSARARNAPHGTLEPGKNEAWRSIHNPPDRPGPHTVNALLYGQRADQYRQEAATHHSMKQLYANDPEMTAHCDKLIKQFTELAAEYEAISKLHEKRAEEFNEPLLKELRK